MGKVKIFSELKSGKVSFEGARVNNKEIGSLEVLAHPTLTNRIIIKSNRQFKRGSSTDYRVFFGKLNINRIQNEAGVDLVATLGMDRTAVIAYVLAQITKPIVTEYFEYNPVTDRLEANKNIEVKKHGFFIGGKYKMASGNSNLYYEDLGTKGNSYPVMGEVFDQSLAANQVAGAGTSTPKMRVFGDFGQAPLGGTPVDNTSIAYDGDNYFPMNISGVGITTRSAEIVTADQQLKYEIIINGISVYIQYLDNGAIAVNEDITWYFDHPLDIEAGTTLRATVYKVSTVDNQEVIDGILNVCEGNATPTRYQTTVLNRLFDDRDLELISPYVHYQAMDFGLDSTGSTILLRDLSLGANSLLQPHAVNTLEAIAEGTTIRIKVKGGAKIIIDSLPVSATSIDGSFVNSVLNQAVVQLNAIFTNTAGFSSGGAGNPVSNFVMSGNDLTITLADGTSYTVDVTSLGVDTDKFVQSGIVSGSNIVLTMNDATTVTIDATNMINGSSSLASNSGWNISYGTNANNPVATSTNDSTVNQQMPFYFGQALEQGSEFKWNFQSNGGANLILGIWDGAEVATAYNVGANTASNWGTMFAYAGGFTDGSNSTLLTTNSGAKYVVSNGDAMGIRFGNDGHLTLIDYSGTNEVAVAKTTIALAVASFNIQMYTWANGVLPNGIINNVDYIWDIVHDFGNVEAGIINGILDHTVIKSAISIGIGEKIMFMLDETGTGDFFGTDYTAASSGVSTAEEQLNNEFSYATNEAISFEFSGVSDWNVNTNASNYFNNGAGIVGYRSGGSGTIQGMFSMRFNDDGKLTIYSEDNGEKIATAKTDPTVGSQVHLLYGVRGNRAYYSIPVISKQTISGGSQPDVNFIPTVANQTATVTEGDVLNFQVITSGNLVNQIVEVDAPTWMSMNQLTGVLSGTAPAFAGTSADTIVVNCKAGNAIGGTVNFTVTVTVAQVAYTNSKSLKFTNSSTAYLNGNHALVTSLQRTGNGSGSSDAWSISIWVKPSTITNAQTIFYYGGDDLTNEGRIDLTQFSGGNLLFRYGNNANNLSYIGVGNFTTGAWNHVLITYSGADTLISGGGATAFAMFINGVNGTSQLQQTGGGYSGNIPADKFRLGRLLGATTSQYLSDGIINQVAIFNTDESANISTIYNSGNTQDLSLLSSAPVHYYEMEASVTTIPDIIGSADLTGFNFSASDLVTDTP
tara:strand:+ start:1473 stop:5066 length:3594 start_codon:yes stop_codon:yes gene_type:complete